MLNLQIGAEVRADGMTRIATRKGAAGYAAWGGNELHQPGKYCALFDIALESKPTEAVDEWVSQVEVVLINEKEILQWKRVTARELSENQKLVKVNFELKEPKVVMFRAYVNGKLPLLVGGYPHSIEIPRPDGNIEELIDAISFPDVTAAGAPNFLVESSATLRHFHEKGVAVRVEHGQVVLGLGPIRINARELDDVVFVPEIYLSNKYNFQFQRDTCVIDVGMNVGLASLFFAAKDQVKEVHAFEPFKPTYERALANFALNAGFAKKIVPRNFGLSHGEREVSVGVAPGQLSGSYSALAKPAGSSHAIRLEDAGRTLAPIIDRALSSGLEIVAKIDCEGSEFAVFDSLDSAGLLEKMSAYLVEWHRGGANKNQQHLLAPLLRSGFFAFDVTPNDRSAGNGFFYAVRCSGRAG